MPLGLLLEPFAEVRADYYDLDFDLNPAASTQLTRTSGLAGATLKWPLVRNTEFATVIIEPTVMAAIGTSSEENAVIPNNDTVFYEYDESSLFEPNPFNGYDRWEGDERLAAGVSASAVFNNGVRASAVFGRRWRSEADPAFDPSTNLNGTRSDYLFGSSLEISPSLQLNTSLRLDDDFKSSGSKRPGMWISGVSGRA